MSADSVVSFSSKAKSSIGVTPEMLLIDALNEVRTGKRQCDRMLILTLNSEGDLYSVGFYNAGLKASEAVAMCETAKAVFLREMGY